ncbi:MAG: hypothetical protein U0325_00270 [Polyangiales bacterium]
MKINVLLGFALLASVAACSSSSGSCSQTTSGNTFCVDYASNVSSDNARSACTGAMGSYSATACSSTNRVGRCSVPSMIGGTQTTSNASFYTPTTDSQARQICTLLGGTYTPG